MFRQACRLANSSLAVLGVCPLHDVRRGAERFGSSSQSASRTSEYGLRHMPPRVLPEVWPSERLEQDRTRAIEGFVERRLREGDPDYLRYFSESEEMVEQLLSLSEDLLNLDVQKFLGRVDLVKDIARFTSGPPVSADDFRTILQLRRIRPGSRDDVGRALEMLRSLIDPTRFGWVARQEHPSREERRAAKGRGPADDRPRHYARRTLWLPFFAR
jgi:hypothetical protein